MGCFGLGLGHPHDVNDGPRLEAGPNRVADEGLYFAQSLALGDPDILIFDEPVNGLDPDGIADMRRFLRSLPERTGRPCCCPATCWARSSRCTH